MISFIPEGKVKDQSSKPHSLIEWTNDHSILMNEKGFKHSWEGKGPLSLKMVLKGEARYEVGGKKFVLVKNRFLILNDLQDYKIKVNNPFETETFIVFFNRSLINAVGTSFCSKHENLLDNWASCNGSHHFELHSHPVSSRIISVIDDLQQAQKNHLPNSLINEKLYFSYDALLQEVLFNKNNALNVHAVKATTRHEIVKRISVVIDFLYSSYDQLITLDDLSSVSCMSKNHLLRIFKQMHGITPFQYLSNIRLEKAKELLRRTELPVHDVVHSTGFESFGYFSTMFKNRTGHSPSAYRSLKK
jgi:AraC family transcriptional regulator